MRRTLPIAIFLIILLSTGIVGAEIWITYSGPFHPGSAFFRLQVFGEQAFERLILDETGRAEYSLSVLLRRFADLGFVRGTEHEDEALEHLNQAIDQASSAVAAAPQDSANLLRPELLQLIQSMEAALRDLQASGRANPDRLAALIAKVNVLKNMLDESGIAQANLRLAAGILLEYEGTATPTPSKAGLPTLTPMVTIQPHVVLFPPGSPGALHEFYSLTGQHGNLDCLSCHSEGRFSGTSNTCESCHQEVRPAGHFQGECSLCHNPASWGEIHFDHASAVTTDCMACHANQKPTNHYRGQCSACHTTSAWRPASFNHQAAGATDCLACHSARKPANHYEGQCSACHNTSSWSGATFNHQAAGATDCFACHSARKPANHYDGQCSQCHNTSTWSGVTFNHTFPTNHGKANGECSACHPSGGSAWTCYNCHEQDKMEKKHTEKDIFDIAARCISCHPTGDDD